MVLKYGRRRKYVKKSKKTTTRRGMSYRKPSYRRRPKTNMNTGDTSISVINPGKDRIVRVQKSLPLNQPYTLGGVTKGMNFSFTTSAATWGQVLVFDPAGIRGNNAGTVALTSSTLSPAAIAEWVAYKVLYAEYRVRKITLKFNASTLAGNQIDDAPVTMFIRYQNEWIANPGTASQVTLGTLAEMRNVVKKTFTNANPDFQYSFYPKVAKLIDSDGIGTGTDSRALKSMGFTSVNTPADLWGVQIYMNWPGSSVGNSALIQCDILYDIEFRTQS